MIRSQHRKLNDKRVVYITCIPTGTKLEELEEILQRYGKITNIYLKDVASKLYKFCFVTFFEDSSAERLINLGDIEINGHKVFLKARKHNKNMNRHAYESNKACEAIKNFEGTVIMLDTNEDNNWDKLCRNKVIRVESIPWNWNASHLYEHLIHENIDIKAVLVYTDSDEYGLCSGLIEYNDLRDAQYACKVGTILTTQLQLRTVISILPNINEVFKSYKGKFTAYGDIATEDTSSEGATKASNTVSKKETVYDTYSYSVAEPFEPNYGDKIASVAFKAMDLPTIPEIQHPNDVIYAGKTNWNMSPSSDCSGFLNYSPNGIDSTTPLSEVSEKNQIKCDLSATKNYAFDLTEFSTARDHLDKENALSEKCNDISSNRDSFKGVFESYRSRRGVMMSMGFNQSEKTAHKPSATIVIDDMEKSFAANAISLAMWMEQFGDVRTADLVSVSNDYYRAYVSFWHPMNADVAHYNLRSDNYAKWGFQVRMA